jgi:hypothetical protein
MSKNNKTPLDFAVGLMSSEFHMFEFDFWHDIHVIQSIANILKCHIVKMKTANLFVSEENLRSLSNSGEVSDFQIRCEKEIVRMKS